VTRGRHRHHQRRHQHRQVGSLAHLTTHPSTRTGQQDADRRDIPALTAFPNAFSRQNWSNNGSTAISAGFGLPGVAAVQTDADDDKSVRVNV